MTKVDAQTATVDKGGNKRTLMWAAVGIVALMVIGGLVATAVLLSNTSTDGKSRSLDTDSSYVHDIMDSPREAWSFNYASPHNEFIFNTPKVLAVGDSTALVWVAFDRFAFHDAQGQRAGWYKGYPADYAEGYSAGAEYAVEYELYTNDLSGNVPQPSHSDFYPAKFENSSPTLGWKDGFGDAEYGLPRGANEIPEPATPDFDFSVLLLDLETGDPVWEKSLNDVFKDYDPARGISAQAVGGTDAIILSTMSGQYGAPDLYTDFVSIDAKSGEVTGTLQVHGDTDTIVLDGKLYILVDPADRNSWVMRANPLDIGAPSIWEAEVKGGWWEGDFKGGWMISALGDSIMVLGSSARYVFDADLGTEIPWGQSNPYDVVHLFSVDGHIIRTDFFDNGDTEIIGQNGEGRASWDRALEVDWVKVSNGVLLIAQQASDWGSYELLQRLDPATGEEVWEQPFLPAVSNVIAMGDVIIAVEEDRDRVVMLEASTGEVIAYLRVNLDEGLYPWFGDRQFYHSVGGLLMAYEFESGTSVWSYGFDTETERIIQIGRHLAVVNESERTLSLLK